MISLQLIKQEHQHKFLSAVARSRELHYPWVAPANDPHLFTAHLRKYESDNNISLLAIDDDGELIACINLNEIVRGVFQSAYLGYYAFAPMAGRGLMYQAMQQVINYAFNELGLHRLEANIQPQNHRSKHLITALGFRLEGYSPRYLRIGNQWKDHERFAMTIEDRPASNYEPAD